MLVGPPVLEFAQYQRIPAGRKKNDPRQGLIDQDPEFISFLESLTNPVEKPANVDAQDAAAKTENTTVTPLIQFLREKKAAKEKASAQKAAKHGRQGSKNDSPAEQKTEKKTAANNSTATAATTTTNPKATGEADEKKNTRRGKAEKTQSETVATPSKKETAKASAKPQPANVTAPSPSVTTASTATAAKPEPAARKVPPTAPGVARMIQRDLGIQSRGNARASRGSKVASNENRKPSSAAADTSTPSNTSSAANKMIDTVKSKVAPAVASTAPAAPSATSAPSARNTVPTAPAAARPARSNPVPSASSTQAFLKHANPSQGVTESLIEQALAHCGKILKVEIDKRKGFAFVDFAEPAGLQKAMADSPIQVAQGSVQILERKDRGTNPGRVTATQTFSPPSGPAASRPSAPPAGNTPRGGRSARGARAAAVRGGAAAAAAAAAAPAAQAAPAGNSAPAPGSVTATPTAVPRESIPAVGPAAAEKGNGT